MNEFEDGVRAFLREFVPPSHVGSLENDWRRRCLAFGNEAVPIILERLALGDENEQYAAVLALRVHGFAAHADGEADRRLYLVTDPVTKTTRTIVPVVKPLPIPE